MEELLIKFESRLTDYISLGYSDDYYTDICFKTAEYLVIF